MENFVDPATVAVHLKIPKREVLNLSRAGKLPAHPIDPTAKRKQWRFLLSEVSAHIVGTRTPALECSTILRGNSVTRKRET